MAYHLTQQQLDGFKAYCDKNNVEHRHHTNPDLRATVFKHDGHWMAVVWNKAKGLYTVDRRLVALVQDYVKSRVLQKRSDQAVRTNERGPVVPVTVRAVLRDGKLVYEYYGPKDLPPGSYDATLVVVK